MIGVGAAMIGSIPIVFTGLATRALWLEVAETLAFLVFWVVQSHERWGRTV